MGQFRFILSILVITGMIFGSSNPVSANIPNAIKAERETVIYDEAIEMACKDGICEFYLENLAKVAASPDTKDEASYLVKARQGDVRVLPNNRGIVIDKAVTLNLPIGLVELFDPKLTLELKPDFSISRITGTAEVPFSLFGATDSNSKMNVSIGLETGKTLQSRFHKHSLEPLSLTQKYIFFYVGPSLSNNTSQITGVTSLSIPREQSFLLIHDPFQAFVYADGQLSVQFPNPATPASVLAIGTALSAGTLLPFLLFTHSPAVHISWLVTPDMADAYLEIEGEYAISEGLLSRISSVDTGAIAVGGRLRIDHDGVVLRGVTEAVLLAGKLFDTGLAVETFIPFEKDFWNTRVVLGGYAAVPILSFRVNGESRLDGTLLQYLFAGALPEQATPKRQPIYVLAKDRASDTVVLAGRRIQSLSKQTAYTYTWTVQGVQDGAGAAAELYMSAKGYAGGQFSWISSLVSEKATASSAEVQLQIERSKNFTIASYGNTTEVISATVAGAAEAVQEGIDSGTFVITDTANSAIESMSKNFDAAIQSAKEVTEDAPKNAPELAVCTLTALRRNWCLWTGFCKVPPVCQTNESEPSAGTEP